MVEGKPVRPGKYWAPCLILTRRTFKEQMHLVEWYSFTLWIDPDKNANALLVSIDGTYNLKYSLRDNGSRSQ